MGEWEVWEAEEKGLKSGMWVSSVVGLECPWDCGWGTVGASLTGRTSCLLPPAGSQRGDTVGRARAGEPL